MVPTQVTYDVTAEVWAPKSSFHSEKILPWVSVLTLLTERAASCQIVKAVLHPVHRSQNYRDTLPDDKKSHQYKGRYYIPFSLIY